MIDEKKQGITIDIAYKYFRIKNKNFVFIDSPGHQEYTKNMVNNAYFCILEIFYFKRKVNIFYCTTSCTKYYIII